MECCKSSSGDFDSHQFEDRVYKFKNRYIVYSIKKRSGAPLVFVFSGVDSTSSFCRMSYYGLRDELLANVVHVMDNFGAHGCYLLSIASDEQVRNALVSLIRDLQSECGVSNDNTFFVGTSKGATTAIAYALMVGGGNVIAGEPQILLGDFIFNSKWKDLEQWRSLAYSMLGRVCEDDRLLLNEFIPRIAQRYGSRFLGRIKILYGETGYWERHVKHFDVLANGNGFSDRVAYSRHGFTSHGDVVPVFINQLNFLRET